MTFHGVLAHVVFEEFGYVVAFVEGDGIETHAWADEGFEFFGVDLAETFESGDLGVGTELFDGGEALFVGVAVDGLVFRTFAGLRLL